jgi:hypothetical protein
MSTIRVRRRLKSATLRIPELRSLLGKDVEIIVIERSAASPGGLVDALNAFDHVPVDPDAITQLKKDSEI